MSNLNQKLSNVLDVDPIVFNAPIEVVEPTTDVVQSTTKVEDDADFARCNIRSLIEKGNQAMDQLLQVANASEHPRAYEVAAGLIKNLADTIKNHKVHFYCLDEETYKSLIEFEPSKKLNIKYKLRKCKHQIHPCIHIRPPL